MPCRIGFSYKEGPFYSSSKAMSVFCRAMEPNPINTENDVIRLYADPHARQAGQGNPPSSKLNSHKDLNQYELRHSKFENSLVL